MSKTADGRSLESHLAILGTPSCTCPHAWKALGILYGISFGNGWVRLDDAEDCPVHVQEVSA